MRPFISLSTVLTTSKNSLSVGFCPSSAPVRIGAESIAEFSTGHAARGQEGGCSGRVTLSGGVWQKNTDTTHIPSFIGLLTEIWFSIVEHLLVIFQTNDWAPIKVVCELRSFEIRTGGLA